MFNIDPITITVLMFCGLLVGLFLGHSLAFVFGGLAVIFGYLTWGPGCFPLFSNRIVGLMDNFILVAIPMFILMANLLNSSGVADGLFDSLRYLMGPIRGGIALAVVIVCTLLPPAPVSSLPRSFPWTIVRLCLNTVTIGSWPAELFAGGSLGILILQHYARCYADMMGLRGQTLSAALSLAYAGCSIRCLYSSHLLVCHNGTAAFQRRKGKSIYSAGSKMCLISLVPPLILILGVLGSIFTGVATPTEAWVGASGVVDDDCL